MTSPNKLQRMLWHFNYDIARYVHPFWLKHWTPSMKRLPAHARSDILINEYQLDIVQADLVDSPIGRLALLEKADLGKIARVSTALMFSEHLKMQISSKGVRNCLRALDNEALDIALSMKESDRETFHHYRIAKSHRTEFAVVSMAKKMVECQRNFMRDLSLCWPSSAYQRLQLRFRPGYLSSGYQGHNVRLSDTCPTSEQVMKIIQRIHLSERARCIFQS